MPHKLQLMTSSGLADPLPGAKPGQRFSVMAVQADGTVTTYTAIGGSSCGHTLAALDLAGLGGVVRVRPVATNKAAA